MWSDKIKYLDEFVYDVNSHNWMPKSLLKNEDAPLLPDFFENNYKKIHYGCGNNLMEGWLNIDSFESTESNYFRVNLLQDHPFEDCSINYAYSEDVLEHFTQAESIFFLSEVFRVLKKNGVLRISFSGLEGVLERHYSPVDRERIKRGELEAFVFWDHVHFYSKKELELVSKHLGFESVEFVKFGESCH